MNANDPKTILLVEDEALIAMNEQRTLENAGYRVLWAASGQKAIDAVSTTPGIDLILMDIDLGGGMDGTEATEIILRDYDLPVVFLSSHTEPEIVERTERITSYGYIVKDLNDTVLLASIKMAFRLFDANDRFRLTFDNSINGIVIHRMRYDEAGIPCDCEYFRANEAFEKHTGLNRKTLSGRTLRELYPSASGKQLFDFYAEAFKSGSPQKREVFFETTGN